MESIIIWACILVYIVGIGLVEMAISFNPIHTLYCNYCKRIQALKRTTLRRPALKLLWVNASCLLGDYTAGTRRWCRVGQHWNTIASGHSMTTNPPVTLIQYTALMSRPRVFIHTYMYHVYRTSYISMVRSHIPSRHKTLNQWWFNFGPAS